MDEETEGVIDLLGHDIDVVVAIRNGLSVLRDMGDNITIIDELLKYTDELNTDITNVKDGLTKLDSFVDDKIAEIENRKR